MEFFFMAILVAAALAVASIKKKPQSYYRKRQAPTWAAPDQRPAFPHPPSQTAPPVRPSRKIAPDGFRYDPEGEWPFQKRKLITDTEKILFERLREALPDYQIFIQVQLSQLVSIKKGHSFKLWFARISRMSVDFVVTDKELNTVAAIELDDKSHYMDEDRQQADAKKDKVLTAAGIRVIRWRCEIMPSTNQIKLSFPEHKEKTKEALISKQNKTEIKLEHEPNQDKTQQEQTRC